MTSRSGFEKNAAISLPYKDVMRSLRRAERSRFPRAAVRHRYSRAAPADQPAGTMTGVRGASLDVPHGLAENPPRSACPVSRSLAQVEPWDEILPVAESRGGTPRGERAALCARRTPLGCGGWLRVSRRSASLLSFLTFVAQGTDRETIGIHRRHSLTKIGAESEAFRRFILWSDEDSGADRIARTRLLACIRPRDSGGGGPCAAWWRGRGR